MADWKNSFLLYKDLEPIVAKLSNEEAGKLFKHLLQYVNDKDPTLDDRLLELVFEPIKQSLKRDLKKRDWIRKKRAEAGKLWGIAKVANASKWKQKLANVAVSVSDIVSDNVIILEGTTNSEIDESIKKQIRELWFPREWEDATKYKILVELVAMWLSCDKTEKWIQSRIADIEKKLDANWCFTVDYLWSKIYNYQTGWNVATNLRERQANQWKPSGNVLNSYARFLSNNKKK